MKTTAAQLGLGRFRSFATIITENAKDNLYFASSLHDSSFFLVSRASKIMACLVNSPTARDRLFLPTWAPMVSDTAATC